MFIHNQFTIFLNSQFHINEQNNVSPLGIKSYYHSTNEPIMFTDNDLIIFIHGRVFNLFQLCEDCRKIRVGTKVVVSELCSQQLSPCKQSLPRTQENFSGIVRTMTLRSLESGVLSVVKESGDRDPYRVLLTIYKTYGIEYLLQVMQGEFVMVIIDQRVEFDEAKIYAVSESMGVIPLYIYVNNPVSSNKEIKYVISTQSDLYDYEYECSRYPGTYAQFSLQRIVHTSWTFDPRMNIHNHYTMPRITNYIKHINYDLPDVLNHQFYLSIWDRFQYDTTTTHVCCLYHMDTSNLSEVSDSKSNETRTEYNILYNNFIKICKKKDMIFSDEYISSDPSTTRVFMVFGGCITDTYEDSSKPDIQIEYEFRNHLKTMVQTILIPLYESFYQEHGIMLEFPWMNSEWLQMYLSLSYTNRFNM